MNRIQKFIISTPDLVVTYILPTANLTTFQKEPIYFGIKVFNHLPTSIKNTSHDKPIQISSQKFPSYKFILLGGIFYLEFQQRSWLSVIILKINL